MFPSGRRHTERPWAVIRKILTQSNAINYADALLLGLNLTLSMCL